MKIIFYVLLGITFFAMLRYCEVLTIPIKVTIPWLWTLVILTLVTSAAAFDIGISICIVLAILLLCRVHGSGRFKRAIEGTAVTETWKGRKIYIVVAGDTLNDIAERFNVTVESIRQNNRLNNNRIQVGQKLTIIK